MVKNEKIENTSSTIKKDNSSQGNEDSKIIESAKIQENKIKVEKDDIQQILEEKAGIYKIKVKIKNK